MRPIVVLVDSQTDDDFRGPLEALDFAVKASFESDEQDWWTLGKVYTGAYKIIHRQPGGQADFSHVWHDTTKDQIVANIAQIT